MMTVVSEVSIENGPEPPDSGATLVKPFVCRLHDDIEKVRTLWSAADTDGRSTVFQSLPWVEAWLQCFGASGEMSFFVAEVSDSHGAPVMLMPLIRRRKGLLVVIEAPDCGVADYIAPITTCRGGLNRADAILAVQALIGGLPQADLVHFPRLPAITHRPGRDNALLELPGVQKMSFSAYTFELEPDFQNLLNRAMSKSRQATARRKRRRLHDLGQPVLFSIANTPGDIDAVMVAAAQQRRERAEKQGWSQNLLDLPVGYEFYRRVAQDPRISHVASLRVGETIVATHVGAVHAGTLYWLLPTFSDGEWERYSVGHLLLEDSVAWACKHNLAAFDLTIGDEAYKLSWKPSITPLYEAAVPLSLKGRITVAIRRAAQALRRTHARGKTRTPSQAAGADVQQDA